MGASKRAQRNQKCAPQMRARTTRSKGKPISDPALNTQALTEQLRSMGLYAANTLGDGNCLFRALSDQLYGTESHHLEIRRQVCDWIDAHKERYAPFCDDERGLETHLRCMRQPATYGGHMELSAFAHLMRRDVKVVQPGLVYVIQSGADAESLGEAHSEDEGAAPEAGPSDDTHLDARECRRLKRERIREAKEKKRLHAQLDDEHPVSSPIYVAYHDWEHFSSIRSLRGPHTGVPNVIEATSPSVNDVPPSPVSRTKKPASKAKLRSPSSVKSTPKRTVAARAKHLHSPAVASADGSAPATPSQIPLPMSRSPSPAFSDNASLPPSSVASGVSSSLTISLRTQRSPKRTFDESSGSSQSSLESAAKRTRSRMSQSLQPTTNDNEDSDQHDSDMDVDNDEDTPALSASGFTTESSSISSLVPSPDPTPPPRAAPTQKPLTKRERKKLGVPKARPALVGHAMARQRSAGKIVIPGGKYKKAASATREVQVNEDEDEEDPDAEWKKNGTGRVDVRGFRELKI